MDLTQLRFSTFVDAVVVAMIQLNDPDASAKLLDAARVDTPIIDEILRAMYLVKVSGNGNQEDAWRALSRDLAVILALRQLDLKAPSVMFPRYAAN